MEQNVIIVAGGSGIRLKSNIPKQFIEVNNKPIFIYSIEKFKLYNPDIRIIVVLLQELTDKWPFYVERYGILEDVEITAGGTTRFHSVYNGLQKLGDTGLVAIHDAARPLLSLETIKNSFEMAFKYGNAVPSIPINDSLRKIENSINYPINRDKIRVIQTPQCFKIELIKKAYNQLYKESFTDDASVVETLGVKINLFDGNVENIKITTEADLKLFKYYLSQESF